MPQVILTYLFPKNSCKKLLLLFTLSLLSISSFSQNKSSDSLKREIRKLRNLENFQAQDSTHIQLIEELALSLRFYKPDSLYSLGNEVLSYSRSINYKKGQLLAFRCLGIYYSDRGNSQKAINNFLKARCFEEVVGEPFLIISLHNLLARAYQFQDKYHKALDEYLNGLETAKKYNNIEMLSIIYENVALLYSDQQDYEQALKHYDSVLKYNKELNSEEVDAQTYSNLAEINAELKKFDYAIYLINKSIVIFEKLEITDWLAHAYQVKGKIYQQQKKYKWALFWFDQSMALHNKSLSDERAMIDVLHGLAEANLGLGRGELSQTYAIKGFNLSQQINTTTGIHKSAKTLYKIHKQNEEYIEALAYHELYQELTDTIYKTMNKKSLLMFKTKINHDQQKQELINANNKMLSKQKYYIYASMIILLILLGITLLIRRNEGIQKRLNKELSVKNNAIEKNENKLKEINGTKDKLFSIIGHDLRGPIGAFQGLLQLYRNGEIDEKEFLTYVPKLGSDIDHISFTLNNLLSWGQSQMQGSTTNATEFKLKNTVEENINLLSEIAENKSIIISSSLTENSSAWADADQIDIVIRNLISNALKFTPKNGSITISAKEEKNHWEVLVEDTGLGIDAKIIDKIFAKNSNITTYGTDNEKGTGLGLSLCKEMVEKNNGTIWVESTINKGACFFFTVPKMDTNKKIAI